MNRYLMFVRGSRISPGDDDVCVFAGLDRAHAVCDAENLGGIDRHSLECLFLWQPVCTGKSRVVRQVANLGTAIAGRDRKLNAGTMKLGRAFKQEIVRVVLADRQAIDVSKDNGNVVLLEVIGRFHAPSANDVPFSIIGKN